MAIANKINIANSQISNCDGFTKPFTDMITNEAEDCDEFSVVCDRYDAKSLKNNRRSSRTKGLFAVR